MTKHIAIITDFGLDDTYLGMMKAAIAGISPDAHIIDLTHAIPPGDVQRAAFEAWRVRPYLPPETVLLAVVDPGVGTNRQAVAIKLPGLYCVGPDNGLFSFLLYSADKYKAAALMNPHYQLQTMSHTFHGRDVFAPAAAHLAREIPLDEFGPIIQDLVRIPDPLLKELGAGSIQGEIMHSDHFGNLITSIGRFDVADDNLSLKPWIPSFSARTLVAQDTELILPQGVVVPLGRTFGDVPQGEVLAYIGSSNLLEIAINGGNAANTLNLNPGDEIVFKNKG
ncbi:MAG TPA: SAM-dependent chlorinase/fluorinase [Anaerolineales bacterium]|nr:SAM-dependent chlorinase/fluorinase [Anaerolineales bacterium]